MRLQPFVKVDETPFDATRAQIERTWGTPRSIATNGVGLIELDYGRAVFRFQASTGRLEEVTKRVACFTWLRVARSSTYRSQRLRRSSAPTIRPRSSVQLFS